MTQLIKIGLTMRISGTVTAKLLLRLVAPKQLIEPVAATFSYSPEDPYAVGIAFEVGLAGPVEWFFARDLLSMGIEGRHGVGDIKVWPSAVSAADAPGSVLNIEISSPSGQAHFEASVREISDFLRRTYQMVPVGEESKYLDVEAELTDLLGQASLRGKQRPSWHGQVGGQSSCVPGRGWGTTAPFGLMILFFRTDSAYCHGVPLDPAGVVVPISLLRRLASGFSAGREAKGRPIMLVLTEAAAEVVKSVTDTPQAPDGTGLRITQSAAGSTSSLELAAAAQPGDNDQVVEASGARVFLDPLAAAYLDDKVLDAEVDTQGKVHFTLGAQNPRPE